MKAHKQLLLLLVAAATIFTGSAYGRKNHKINSKTEKEIIGYFSKTLNNEPCDFENRATVRAEQIQKAREQVWQAWRNAVNNYDEEKLPSLGMLEQREITCWDLPAELEPSATMPFYWGVNEKLSDNGQKYPMFLYMHGSGSKRQEWENGLRFSLGTFHKPAAYFVPQIPNAYGELYRWAIQSKQWAWEKLLRLLFLNNDIDHNRIYFFGISEGGYGSQRLASFYADYLAGAGPMAGGEPLKNAPMENLANIAFSLRTGSEDHAFCRNILTAKAGEVADSLSKIHPELYKHFIETIPGYGHGIDYAPTTPWLAQFSRNPHPKYFHWEDFDMYGRHRKGFYNIRVNETSSLNQNERTCYDVKIENNTVTIDVKNVTYTTTHKWGNIDMLFAKNYSTANTGNITLFLNETLFDLGKPVKIVLNGTEVFNDTVQPSIKAMVESCALFFDPERIFPAAINIDIAKKNGYIY